MALGIHAIEPTPPVYDFSGGFRVLTA